MGLITGYKALLAHSRNRASRKKLALAIERGYKRAQDKSARFLGVVPGLGGALLYRLYASNPRIHGPWTFYLSRGKGWMRLSRYVGEEYADRINQDEYKQRAVARYNIRRRWIIGVILAGIIFAATMTYFFPIF